jgi:hypothetical protein
MQTRSLLRTAFLAAHASNPAPPGHWCKERRVKDNPFKPLDIQLLVAMVDDLLAPRNSCFDLRWCLVLVRIHGALLAFRLLNGAIAATPLPGQQTNKNGS